MYKVVEKVLSKRFKRVLGKIIDERQSAFVGGRFLLDGVMVANEVMDEVKKDKKQQCLIFKVDFEKAYDSMRWKFLYYMLSRLGFCDLWIKWIKGCLESASLSVLVIGSPSEKIVMQKGLHQGDSLAPFLYLCVAKGLTGLMREAISKDLFQGIKVGKKQANVNLLQFEDDTLFFPKPCLENVLTLKSKLRCFELVCGLRINFFKSKLDGVGESVETIETYASLLNCNVMSILPLCIWESQLELTHPNLLLGNQLYKN